MSASSAGRLEGGNVIDRLLRGHAAAMFLFLYLPIALVVLFSFTAGERTGELRGLSMRWYGRALANTFMVDALRNSLVVAAATAAIATTLGTAAALGLQRAPRGVRAAIEAMTYVAIVIPGIVIAIATLIFFVNLWAWLNPWIVYLASLVGITEPPEIGMGLHTIIAAHVVFTMAVVLVVVQARLSGMDRSLVEASMDLYAPPLATFRQVTLPQLRPAIVAGGLLAFTFSFDDYIVASFTQGPGQGTLPLYVFSSIRRGITPEINAIGTMILAVTLTILGVAYVVFRRQARQFAATRASSADEPIGAELVAVAATAKGGADG